MDIRGTTFPDLTAIKLANGRKADTGFLSREETRG